MRSRTIASIAIALMTAPSLQPLAGAQLPGTPVTTTTQPPPSAGTTISGAALRTDLRPLPAATVRLRQFDTTSIVGSVTAGASGEFTFPRVQPGSYMLELVDCGRVIGMVPPFAVSGTTPIAVSVVASGVTSGCATGGGFNLLGLGPAATLAVLGAAGAAAVTAVVATKSDASPSK